MKHGVGFRDVTGQRFTRLRVIRFHSVRVRRAYWLCSCDCGNRVIVHGAKLRNGHTQSCGCLKNELIGKLRRTHGRRRTPEYTVWVNMRQRCYNPNQQSYKSHGARGIRVCREWRTDFARFFHDMGPRPSSNHQIERVDNDGHYCPANCVWATQVRQGRNKRNNRLLTWKGKTLPLSAWADKLGVPYHTLYARWQRGYPPHKLFAVITKSAQ